MSNVENEPQQMSRRQFLITVGLGISAVIAATLHENKRNTILGDTLEPQKPISPTSESKVSAPTHVDVTKTPTTSPDSAGTVEAKKLPVENDFMVESAGQSIDLSEPYSVEYSEDMWKLEQNFYGDIILSDDFRKYLILPLALRPSDDPNKSMTEANAYYEYLKGIYAKQVEETGAHPMETFKVMGIPFTTMINGHTYSFPDAFGIKHPLPMDALRMWFLEDGTGKVMVGKTISIGQKTENGVDQEILMEIVEGVKVSEDDFNNMFRVFETSNGQKQVIFKPYYGETDLIFKNYDAANPGPYVIMAGCIQADNDGGMSGSRVVVLLHATNVN